MSDFLINGHSVRHELKGLAEKGNKSFCQSLHPGVPNILGIRIPDLRSLARQIVADDWEKFLLHPSTLYMEERILYGLVLGCIDPDENIEKYLARVTSFVHVINSWSVCDTFTFAGGKRYVNRHQEVIWSYLKVRMEQTEEYEVRFGIVMALKYFIDDKHLDELLACLDRITHDGYYVKMAVAWAVSVCFVKYPERVMAYLKKNHLDDFTYNKSLQKILESYRVDLSLKEVIRSMKR